LSVRWKIFNVKLEIGFGTGPRSITVWLRFRYSSSLNLMLSKPYLLASSSPSPERHVMLQYKLRKSTPLPRLLYKYPWLDLFTRKFGVIPGGGNGCDGNAQSWGKCWISANHRQNIHVKVEDISTYCMAVLRMIMPFPIRLNLPKMGARILP
jgi:hypothetical protein